MISVLHCLAFYESDSTEGSLVFFSGVHWRGKEKKEEISTWAKKANWTENAAQSTCRRHFRQKNDRQASAELGLVNHISCILQHGSTNCAIKSPNFYLTAPEAYLITFSARIFFLPQSMYHLARYFVGFGDFHIKQLLRQGHKPTQLSLLLRPLDLYRRNQSNLWNIFLDKIDHQWN